MDHAFYLWKTGPGQWCAGAGELLPADQRPGRLQLSESDRRRQPQRSRPADGLSPCPEPAVEHPPPAGGAAGGRQRRRPPLQPGVCGRQRRKRVEAPLLCGGGRPAPLGVAVPGGPGGKAAGPGAAAQHPGGALPGPERWLPALHPGGDPLDAVHPQGQVHAPGAELPAGGQHGPLRRPGDADPDQRPALPHRAALPDPLLPVRCLRRTHRDRPGRRQPPDHPDRGPGPAGCAGDRLLPGGAGSLRPGDPGGGRPPAPGVGAAGLLLPSPGPAAGLCQRCLPGPAGLHRRPDHPGRVPLL